jgi:hypothetical protein
MPFDRRCYLALRRIEVKAGYRPLLEVISIGSDLMSAAHIAAMLERSSGDINGR